MGNSNSTQAHQEKYLTFPDGKNDHIPVIQDKYEIPAMSNNNKANGMCVEDESNNKKLVAAIDFGTTYSGYAFAFHSEYKKNQTDITINKWDCNTGAEQSPKTPTTALFSPAKKFHSFGYKAEEKYAELIERKEHKNWYFFKRFKMELYGQKKMHRDLLIKDVFGNEMSAKTVFSECIGYMKKHLMDELANRNPGYSADVICWVITIPAIWNESAKQFMRAAANEAGIKDNQLTFALEPEAAAIYCKTLPEGSLYDSTDADVIKCFQPGGKYMILDLGGGTVDSTVHGVNEDGSIVEIHEASGGPWGGITVNDELCTFIENTFGKDCVLKLKESCYWDWISMEKEFEVRKRQVDYNSDQNIRLVIPAKIIVESNKLVKELTSYNKLKVEREMFRKFFQPSTEHIVQHIEKVLKVVQGVQLIFMVGGFSESPYVRQVVQKRLSDTRVIVPLKACLSVLKGAVLYGLNPESIKARVCRFTYGIRCHIAFDKTVHPREYFQVIDNEEKCMNIFSIFVESGETIEIHEERTKVYTSSHRNIDRKNINLAVPVFASTSKQPVFTTQDGCTKLGSIVIQPPATGWPDSVHFEIHAYFGRTEFSLKVKDATNKRDYSASFDFLEIEEVL